MTALQLFEQNKNLAYFFLQRYKHLGELEDLKQLALLGLHVASERYDPTKGTAFSTFAFFYVQKEILRYVEKNFDSYHVPRPVRESMAKIRALKLENASAEEILEKTDLTPGKVKRALHCMTLEVTSLDAQVFKSDNSELTMGETIADVDGRAWGDDIFLDEFLSSLAERDRKVVQLRLEGKSQRAVGEVLGISQVQISRILIRIQQQYRTFAS